MKLIQTLTLKFKTYYFVSTLALLIWFTTGLSAQAQTAVANPPADPNPTQTRPSPAQPGTSTSGPSQPTATTTKPATAADQAQLQKVVVQGVAPEATTLPTRPTDSVYGLGDSVLDTPRSVYEVSRNQLRFDPINQVSDLARYSPGITAASGQGIGGAPYIRGYTAEVYQDGFRVGRFLRPFDPTTAYENLDIVTGPASVVYGPSSKTSGYLDWTTKKPYFDGNHTQLDFDFGQWVSGGQGGHADFSQAIDNSGPLSKDVAYRVVYKQSEASSYYIGGKNDYEHFYGALTWLPKENISVDWNFEYGNYDYGLVRGWNRITQDLIDNGTYLSGTATPILKSGGAYYEPNATSTGFVTATPNANGSKYTTGGAYTLVPNAAGSIVGYVLRPVNVTAQQIYPYQGAVNPTDPINLHQYIAEQNATITVDPQTVVLNKSYYEHDDYNQQTYGFASLQGTISDSFENRTEVHLDNQYKLLGIDVEHKSNSGLDLHFLDETVNFNNSNFSLQPYDISGNQSTNLNLANILGITSINPISGVATTSAYGPIALSPNYAINGFDSPLAGAVGAQNYESKLGQLGLYTFHEFTFDQQWTLNVGLRGTATYVADKNPVEASVVGDRGYGTTPKDSTLSLEPVFTTSLSYKPAPWTTLYLTYNYTQALNDDSGNSAGGVGYNNNGQIGRAALHSDSVLYETGAKFEIVPNQLFGSLAAYYQERQLTPIVIPGANSVTPEVHSHGIEAALNYQPNAHFNAGINYSWIEANYQNYNPNQSFASPYGVVADGTTVLSSAAGSLTATSYPRGNYPVAEPKNRIDAYTSYQFDWGLGFRADLWATSQFAMTNNLATIPAEYNIDLGAFFAKPNWRVQLDVLNVTSQRNFEIANQDSGENLLPSEPLAVQGKFSYNF